MLYLNGSPSATDNTSGISLLPEIYNQKFKETTANADIQGTFNLLGSNTKQILVITGQSIMHKVFIRMVVV